MGMGLLLILIGTFSSFVQALPKSGGWMTLVKNTLGFLLLFVALYYGQLAYNEFKPHAPEKHYQHGWIGYSEEALNKARKENKPANNAEEAATAMGAELINEDEYKDLQKLGKFDTKTSSWLKTPPEVRALGGAIFGDR